MADFLKKVADGFRLCGVDVEKFGRVGVAVSGGADSVSLLLACVEIFGRADVAVLTVNHNIRPENESAGDASFVAFLCGKLGVECEISFIPRGKVLEVAEKRGGGIEDAARALRYEAFEDFIERKRVDCLCLAHNQNDQLETALMRFLQGSGCDGGGGISRRRGKFVRPLLGISRAEIEEFLKGRNQEWRTDSTNSDTNYLRNRIRSSLMKELDSLFPGWRKSVLLGAEKNSDDNETLQEKSAQIASLVAVSGSSVSIGEEIFYSLDNSIKRRVFQIMLTKIKFFGRFPYKLIREISSWERGGNRSVRFSSVEVSVGGGLLSIKPVSDCGGCGSGFFRIADGFVFRSFQSGDEIRMKDGRMKSVAKIFSDWKVGRDDRDRITVVQDCASLELVAVLGGKLGYADWIVDGFSFSTADN